MPAQTPVTLAAIFVAHEAWVRLAALKLPPDLAYRLLKYLKQVKAEYDVIKQQEHRLIREKAGVGEQAPARLAPGSAAFQAYAVDFNAVLDTVSDLAPFDLTLEALLGIIGRDQANVLSMQDLAYLEPFFA